jgi:hypothetical protein
LPISKPILILGAVLAFRATTAAAESDPCWECRAAACYSSFKDAADRAWRETEAEAMARWDVIRAATADLDAANAEHDVLVAGLERQRDGRVEAAYNKMLACLAP